MGYNVLIVDDSAVMRKIVVRAVNQIEFPIDNLYEAGDGEEALSIVEQNNIDLILTDINMPKMDGLEFIKKLNEMDKLSSTSVIMITTEGSESKVIQAIKFGAKAYIKKPFNADQLQDKIKSLFSF